MKGKPFYLSKTFWVNLLALVAAFLQYYFGWVMPPELQATFLAVINLMLRVITKEPITWSKGSATVLCLVVAVGFLSGGCAGVQVCDELSIVLTDTNSPDHTKVLMLCDGQTVAEIQTSQVFGLKAHEGQPPVQVAPERDSGPSADDGGPVGDAEAGDTR